MARHSIARAIVYRNWSNWQSAYERAFLKTQSPKIDSRSGTRLWCLFLLGRNSKNRVVFKNTGVEANLIISNITIFSIAIGGYDLADLGPCC